MSRHPYATVAAVKRALTPGTRIHIVNHVRPTASRDTVVLEKTNTVDLVTAAPGAEHGSHLAWPKASCLRPDAERVDTFHIDSPAETDHRGRMIGTATVPFLTITVTEPAVMTPSSITTVTRADWGGVTLGEYAALDLLKRPDLEQLMNVYWDRILEADPMRGPEDVASRLTPQGSAWLAGLHATVTTTLDERDLVKAARFFIRSMGTMLTMNLTRLVKDKAIAA